MDQWTILYGVTILILVGTLIVWVAQYRRMYGRKKRGSDTDDPDKRDH